ncbi:MAG: hypothetical protein GX557_09170 [Chloroflexi bacterium]|nr:hypothetical protein [Chloroflexota bacterium]
MVEEVKKAAATKAVDGNLACADAHDLAAELGVAPLELGRVVNKSTELRFDRCQLGLFGYGSKAAGHSKIVLTAARVPPEIGAALEAAAVNGKVSCAVVWQVAATFRYPRLGVANIAEAMGLKIAPCQLGCF